MKKFKDAFGVSEYGMINFPIKLSGIRISRIEIGDESGCSRCFPHGFEVYNRTVPERNWKSQRKKQWKRK